MTAMRRGPQPTLRSTARARFGRADRVACLQTHVAFDRLKYRYSIAIAVEPDRRARVRDSHDFCIDGGRPRPYHAAIL